MRKNKQHKRNPIWIIAGAIAIAAIVFAVLSFTSDKNEQSESGKSTQQNEIIDENQQEITNDSTQTESQTTEESKKIINNEGEDPNSFDAITGNITYAAVQDEELSIRVNIDQYTSGQCNLKLIHESGEIYEENAAIIDSAATSTCEGFDILINALQTGHYNIEIEIIGADKTGTIEGEVDL